jgi:endonuclease YncB( thermonuclease family)
MVSELLVTGKIVHPGNSEEFVNFLGSQLRNVGLAWASLGHAEEFSGKVVGISDGDTLTVLRERTPVKLRLHGIDAVRRVI